MSRDWYRREPRAAINGMAGLTLEERGAYNTIIDYLYLFDGPLADDDVYVSGLLGCHVLKWRAIKMSLVAKNRILIQGGKIDDEKAVVERSRRDELGDARRSAGHAGGIASGKSRKANAKPEANASSNRTREDKIRVDKIPPLPPKGDDFEREFLETFWPAYPRKDAKKQGLKAFLKARKAVPLDTIMAGVKRYAEAMAGRAEFVAYAASWLNGERWEDEHAQKSQPGWRPNGTGVYVRQGSREWEAWRQKYIREQNPRQHEFIDKAGSEVKVASPFPDRRTA